MTNLLRSRPALVAASALVGALALAGCSSAPSAEPGGEASGGTMTLRVSIAPANFETVYLAQEQGFFEAEGLTVEVVAGGAPPQAIPQLLSGEVDIAQTSGAPAIASVSQGLPIAALMPAILAVPEPVTSGVLAKPDSGITSWKDLTGKTVASPAIGELADLSVRMLVDQDGGDSSTVEVVQVDPAATVDAIQDGTVDAGIAIATFYGAGVAAGLTDLGQSSSLALEGAPNSLFVTTQDQVASNAPALEAFVAAMQKAAEYAIANPDAVRAVEKQYTKIPPEVIDASTPPAFVTAFDEDGFTKSIEAMLEYGYITTSTSYEDIVWSEAR